LDRDELLKTSGAWTYSSSTTNLDSKDLFQDIIECPDNNRNLEECIYTMKILNPNIIISNKLDPSSARLKNNMRFP
jgi:hypothetical protein